MYVFMLLQRLNFMRLYLAASTTGAVNFNNVQLQK